MASKHNLSRADSVYQGGGYFPPAFASNERMGVPVAMLTKVSLGSPIAINAAAVLASATSTELPNAATKTYTTADSGTSPIDDAGKLSVATITTSTGASASVFVLDVPRNITAAATHGSSVLAMTIVLTGYDVWGQLMTESLSIAAGTASQSATGKKAFKYISSIAITAAGNATTNTLSMGFGDVLGLPYKLADKSDLVRVFFNGVADATPTVVVAATATATATTGDVRGTIDTTSASDGSAVYAWMHVADKSTDTGLVGVAQA